LSPMLLYGDAERNTDKDTDSKQQTNKQKK